MKKVHVVVYSALLLLFGSALSQAQQSLASTRDSDSNAGSQAISNVSGTGTKDYVPLWLSGSKLGNSNIFQSPAGIGIGTTAPAAALDVSGAVNAATSFNLRGSPFAFGTLSKQNAFVGFSGNSSMTGGANTASGVQALQGNTKGAENTASGYRALLHGEAIAWGMIAALYISRQRKMVTEGEAGRIEALRHEDLPGALDDLTPLAAVIIRGTGCHSFA